MTFRLLFLTDIHLNFCNEQKIKELCKKILLKKPNAVVITGDISEAGTLETHLAFLGMHLKRIPIFFVCGNHDFYYGSILGVRSRMQEIFTYSEASKKILSPKIGYLSSSGIIPLTSTVALLGHDGWYDGGYANWFKSKVGMSDYTLIKELSFNSCPTKELRYQKIQALAKESAYYIADNLDLAMRSYEYVFVATHVPPWPENSVYNGKMSDEDWMPHFSSKAVGDAIINVAKKYPKSHAIVLCGHSHGRAYHEPASNIQSFTGAAKYHFPDIAKVFDF